MTGRAIGVREHPESQFDRVSRLVLGVGLLPILLVAMIAFMAVVEQKFFGLNNIFNVLRSTSFLAIVAAGQMLVLIVGGFDLSVGAVIALTSTVMAKVMAMLAASMPDQTGLVITVGILAGLACGVFIGLINGLCVAFLRISPFMVTLGTLSIASGIGLLLTNGIPVYGMPDAFVKDFGRALWLGLPTTVYIAVAIIAAVWFIQQHTRLGRYIYAIGGNLQAAIVSGVPATGYLVLTYVMCSVLASIAGILMTARLGSGQATMGGNLMMLQSIAAAVIAGVSLRGGIGRVEMVALGALFLSILTNAMNLLRVDSKMQVVVLGIILVAAVALDEWGKRRQLRG
ncbi:monosaccharide ABC transporter membrane protein (CUT2 family) [Tepidamorphus gemmatus]|uniref:Monosaccharide ABC transporter membrane protein (CUT2 family) n=1 Tax=Tepidamorphus gemmatus TaxID=747076 RepID=A0A4R3M8Z8_9HYPH|nr:ABC transporter permease [Tepidamorphus gemmatus]TCT09890.1 monosaccharide ABC transporter membrane protein (CUT2 family) [Tepidamorphus gemmatus]